MSTLNVDIIENESGTPGDNTPVQVNGAKIYCLGLGMRSLSIGDDQKAITPGYGINADAVHIGTSVFPPATGYYPQTIAIGSLIADLSADNGCSQSIFIGTEVARNIGNSSSDNIFIGYKSGESLTGLNDNNLIVGSQSGKLITSGNQNTLYGAFAGSTLTSGGNNVCVGFNSNTATATTSNSITLGNSSHTVIRAAVTTITSLSDERDKKDIETLPLGLEFVDKLKPVKFVWNDRDENGKHDVEDFGFIAQDLKAVQEESEASYLNLVYDENPDKLEASYGKLLPILVKAIQEMSTEIKSLKEEILTLKTK
jgi:Ca2+-binding RTX toxin-like protein